jgi:hypothetical protein
VLFHRRDRFLKVFGQNLLYIPASHCFFKHLLRLWIP